jgi:hypothetical protein
MLARVRKRVHESVLVRCRGLFSAGRQTVRGSPLALFNLFTLRRTSDPSRPQYVSNRIEVPLIDCFDGLSFDWLAVGNPVTPN